MHSSSRLIFSHPLNDSLNAILTDKQSVEEQGSSDNYPDAQWDGKSRKSINDTVFNSTWRAWRLTKKKKPHKPWQGSEFRASGFETLEPFYR